MTNHDARYRDLFSNVYMVRALFEGILQACVDSRNVVPDAEQLDWANADMQNTGFIAATLEQRHSDCVWRLPYRDGRTVFVLLLLEHQSQVDTHMALRILVYIGLLYQSLIKQGQISARDRYPPVLPVVIYSGIRPWNAATILADKLSIDPASRHLQPAIEYILIDEGELLRRGTLPDKDNNLAGLLFRLEHCDSIEQFQELVHTLGKRLRHPRYDELRRSFLNWLKTALWPRYIEDIDIGHIHSLQELDTMLIEERPTFTEQWRQKGREEGRTQGEAQLLRRLLARRFGPLSDETLTRIESATSAQLEAWSLNILDAKTLEDVFKAASRA